MTQHTELIAWLRTIRSPYAGASANALEAQAREIAELKAENLSLTETLATTNTALLKAQEDIVTAQNSANRVAAESLAAIGQPAALELETADKPAATTPHLDAFNKLTGREASAYWKEHKEAIGREQRAAK